MRDTAHPVLYVQLPVSAVAKHYGTHPTLTAFAQSGSRIIITVVERAISTSYHVRRLSAEITYTFDAETMSIIDIAPSPDYGALYRTVIVRNNPRVSLGDSWKRQLLRQIVYFGDRNLQRLIDQAEGG